MTNIKAPTNESNISYNAYVNAGMINETFEFHIPIYNNMPALAATYPTIEANAYYEADNTKVYLDDTGDTGVNDVFNIRLTEDESTPGNIISVITETKEGQDNRTVFTRIAKGVNTGWDKIRLADGREGYVKAKYVKVYNYTKVAGVTLNSNTLNLHINDAQNLVASINPSTAKYKDVVWSTNDSSIVTVNQSGNIVAKKLGTATITVTTVDQNMTATCTVNVVSSNVASITLSNTEYKIIKDTYLTIDPIILPTTAVNKNYTITIANENIAKLENGKIKGIAVGETNVTFTTTDGNKTAVCLVKVLELPVGTNVLFDSSLTVTTTTVTKISPLTKISDIKQKITTLPNYTIEIKNIADKVLTDTENIGTGSKIIIKNETGTVLNTFDVVIYGEISGDGIIDSLDILKLRKHLLQISILQGDLYKAANVSKDSENIVDSLDILKLRKHLLGIATIEQ